MASVLTDFTKKREFLVCMDSDGCVMDTVSIKHTIVMCPELIRVFCAGRSCRLCRLGVGGDQPAQHHTGPFPL